MTRARAVAVAALAVAVGGMLAYLPFGRHAPRILDVEIAGTAAAVRSVVADRPGSYISALYGDFLLIPGYVTAVALAAAAMTMVSRRTRWAVAAAVCGLVAGGCDVAENLALLAVLHGAGGDDAARAAQVLATVKFTLLAYAVPAALLFVGIALRRGRRRP